MRSAQRFPLVLAFLLSTAAPGWAAQTYWAVTKSTRDGFVALRTGPGARFAPVGKLLPHDFLYVGTEQCRNDFGRLLCSENGEWVFVEKVVSRGGGQKKL